MAACAAFLASSVHGDTVYDGTGRIDQANWSNEIPSTAGNPGTINDVLDSGAGSLRGGTYFITQNAGTLSNSFGNVGLSAGNWTLEDGSIQVTNGDLTLSSSQVFTQNGGSVTAGSDDFIVSSGASYVMNDGTLSVGDDTIFTGGTISIHGGTFTTDVFNAGVGTFTMTGGALNVNTLGALGEPTDGGFTMNFNGGTTMVAGSFGYNGDTNISSVIFGGTNAGSLVAAGFSGGPKGTMNWLAGSQMSMTITGNSTWAETEYNAGRLLYNGDNNATLGLTWTEATSGETAIWNFTTDTLSLFSVAPPVSSPFAITSFAVVVGEPGVWQLTLTGDVTTNYVFRSSTNLDFSTGTLVENLTAGVPVAGMIGGTNNSVVTTDGGGQASVRLTLTGNPADFVRAESAP